MASPNTFSVPPDLMAKIEAAAREAHKTPYQWVVEIMERELQEARWQDLLKRTERHARDLGIKEEHVPDLVHQYRRERRR